MGTEARLILGHLKPYFPSWFRFRQRLFIAKMQKRQDAGIHRIVCAPPEYNNLPASFRLRVGSRLRGISGAGRPKDSKRMSALAELKQLKTRIFGRRSSSVCATLQSWKLTPPRLASLLGLCGLGLWVQNLGSAKITLRLCSLQAALSLFAQERRHLHKHSRG